MGSLEDLEARVAALETQMRSVRQEAAAARVLAGEAGQHVSAFSTRLEAQQRLLEALRETQIEEGERLARHHERFSRLESEVRSGFSTLADGQADILAQLSRMNGSDEEYSPSAE